MCSSLPAASSAASAADKVSPAPTKLTSKRSNFSPVMAPCGDASTLSRNSDEAKSAVNQSKPYSPSEMNAAINSLKSEQGPLGTGPINCSTLGPGSAYCESASNGVSTLAAGTPSWTNITSSGFSRYLSAMSYDAADGYVILFGGIDTANNFLGDTWKFSAGVWTNITKSSGPSPRASSAMVYDSADGYVVLFGGGSGALDVFPTISLHDTWKFSGGSWTNVTATSSPPPLFL